ncbi:type II secretion system secretin GspD [Paludibacterium purpuratum]|uniref:General secretion pathway protein D n=1 Tax=Paludibacterium purpuratum TaxID=1144873 RepID=A0A4V3DU29_9NEIS|nr:type II secretion system secretin GspD [Paludibacterium purpuratum]TDR70755.1 general secretion pathway protein D [Paludibacterium purpuratum]
MKRLKARKQALTAVLFCLAFACSVLPAVAAEPSSGETVTLNFANADIDTVVRAIGELTGRNFLLDPRVKGTVNIISAQPVSRQLAYQILLSSLRLQGFSAVEGNGVVKIVPEADAKLHARVGSTHRGDGERLITRVFMLKNSNAAQLLPVIRPIVSPNNALSAFAQANALVVTDYADNIRRIESIVASVEGVADGQTAVIPLLYASAPELAGTLTKLMQDNAADGSRLNINADSRANVLLVRADLPGRLNQVKQLVRMLDQPSQAGANVRVIYLKNADAARVAQTLRALLSSSAAPLTETRKTSSLPSSSAASGIGQGTTGGNADNSAVAQPTSAPSMPSSSDNGTADTQQQQGAAGNAGSLIQADTASNALILNVPDSMYRNLRTVVDLLDRRRAQVYVETLVMEVSAQRLQELGVQWMAQQPTAISGSTSGATTGGNLTIQLANQGLGLSAGTGRGVLHVPGLGNVLDLTALARALETKAEGNVLSNPTLMATDNEPARIEIAKEVSVQTAQSPITSGSSGATTVYNSFDRKTVGLKLAIVPQISEGGTVRMKILQTASSIDPNSANTLQPEFNIRSVETSVTVDDGGIIAIGGLIQETVNDTEDKVPLLGDLPGVGWLFRHQTKSRVKTNLLVFLKPTILRDDAGARAIAEDRYRYIIGESERKNAQPLPLDAKSALESLPTGIKALQPESKP